MIPVRASPLASGTGSTPAPTLFATPAVSARELAKAEIPRLQALFDANPEYFQAVNERPAFPDEARREFDERPPAHLAYTQRWFIGVFDRTGELVGTVVVVADLVAAGVWHVALFLLATRLHGRGIAPALYAALEDWARANGACWIRLAVVEGNTRAERFWERRGFADVRRRTGVDTGGLINDVRVLVKPLAGHHLETYLSLVPRDRPGSTLP